MENSFAFIEVRKHSLMLNVEFTQMSFAMWTKASARRKRVFSIIAVFIVALGVTAIGSLTPMDPTQANEITGNFDDLKNRDVVAQTAYILGNNFLICLLMFVPVIGPILGLSIMFNSGTYVGAIAAASNFPPIFALFALLVTPVGWLEFAAYSIGMAESVWLFRRLLQRRGIKELKNTSVFISICAILLTVGAIVEVALLSLLS